MQRSPNETPILKIVRISLVILFALCCGHWAQLCLQDIDRQNVALAQHVWFMLLSVLAIAVAVGFLCKKSIFGALLGALVGMVFPTIFLHGYTLGYTYWEPRPTDSMIRQNIVGPTLDGGTFDLQNCKGKLLLVDYWATWCRPCVAGLPHIQEVWAKYHDQGLDIVGVSLDKNREHLADFVSLHEIAYPQIYFDDPNKNGYNNPIAAAGKVEAIPQLDLVEPQSGMVLTTVPYGRDLNWTVKSALDALKKAPLADLDVTHKRLAAVSLPPYIFGVIGGIIGALVELFAWRRVAGTRPKLHRVK